MTQLTNSKVIEEKRMIFEDVLQKLEKLKFEEVKSFQTPRDVDEKIKIEQFNLEINDMKSILQVAYECLHSAK